jgi:hypothetical protein
MSRLFLALALSSVLGGCSGEYTTEDPLAVGGAGPVERENFAAVFVTSVDLTGAGRASSAGAGFIREYDSFCSITEVQGCRITDCDFHANITAAFLSAGAIRVDGGLREVTLQPDEDNTYDTDSSTLRLFDGGESLEVHAAGSEDVPAFDATVVAPFAVTFTSPSFVAPLEIDRAKPLAIEWLGWRSGDVGASLVVGKKNAEGSPTRVVTAQCRLHGAPGAGAIPSEILGELPPTDDGDSATLALAVQTISEVELGDWTPVRVSASAVGGTPEGDVASVEVVVR